MPNTQEAFEKWLLSNQPEYFHANVIERVKDRKIKAFRAYESDFTEGKWLAWQANQAHNDTVIAELQAEVQHWKANHAHEVERARLLKVRTDLPIERLHAYDRASIDNVNELVVALDQLLIVKDRAGIGGGGSAYEVMRQAAWANAENVSAKHKKGTA